MIRDDIIELLGQDWTSISEIGEKALSSDICMLNSVNSFLSSNQGKRLRPMMSLLVARLCGTPNSDSRIFAVASELLHNATLIHDDVADASNMRRGQPTVSAMLGPGHAVLVGDFWLARTMQLLASTSHRNEVVDLYSKTLSDLAEGEMLQLEKSEICDTTEADYLRVIYCKTASLFEVSCRAAAISVDATPEMIEAVASYAVSTGLAFQIKDDILDYCGHDTGKPAGIDVQEKKITLPLLGAMLNNPREKEIRELIKTVDKVPENCSLIHEFVLENGGVEYASSRLMDYIEDAVKALSIFPDCKEKEYLEGIAHYNAMREI